ncbi:MAG TPA: choice-of-anchor P family protein [Verrucomicrobiae bacterium]|jgi:hypothetical protein|nr:choice-of-anchor P family protein [Verrucomicrobiae bacterium]
MPFKICLKIAALAVIFPLVVSAQEFNLSPTFAGRAVALQATASGAAPVILADTGVVPATGGERQNSAPGAVAYPGGTAVSLYAVTVAFGNQNRSQASLSALDVSLGGHRVTAQWVESVATAQAQFLGVLASGNATVNDLTIDGVTIAVSGEANQTVNLPDGYVIINEQTGSNSRDGGAITVNAIHLVVNGVGSVVAASATAKVVNSPTRNLSP